MTPPDRRFDTVNAACPIAIIRTGIGALVFAIQESLALMDVFR